MVFFHHNVRPEVGSDVISGVVVDPTGIKIRVEFGDSNHHIRAKRLSTYDYFYMRKTSAFACSMWTLRFVLGFFLTTPRP